MLLVRALENVITKGSVELTDATGKTHHIVGSGPGPDIAIGLHDKALHRKLLTNPFLYVGEAYMDGTLTIDRGSLEDFLEFCCAGCNNTTPSARPRRTSRTITTCRTSCTIFFSTATGNIPAPISSTPRRTAWKPPSSRKSAT